MQTKMAVVQIDRFMLAPRDEVCVLLGSLLLFPHKRGPAPFLMHRALRLQSAAGSIAYFSPVVRKTDRDSPAVEPRGCLEAAAYGLVL